MNKTYRSVWNESTGTWVAVQENATGRAKRSTSRKLAVGSVLGLVGVSAGLHGTIAAANTLGNGGLTICSANSSSNGTAIGYAGVYTNIVGCSKGIAFALGNSENYQGGDDGTGPSPTVGIAGWGNGSLTLMGTAGILMKNAVLMSGNQINQLAPGSIASSSTDAVNGSQLYATNLNVANLTNVVNNIGDGSGLKYFHANSSLADSTVTGADSLATGPAATASASGAVALGANSVADRANSVSVGSATAQRQITNMAAGAGNYKSGSAVGVGATYRSRDGKWLVNGALSVTTSGDAGVRAQVGYEF